MFLPFFKTTVLLATAKKFQKRLPLIFALISGLFLPLTAQAAPGDLDSSFGNGGKVPSSDIVNSGTINSIAIQSDGKIIAAGSTFQSGGIGFSLVRLSQNYYQANRQGCSEPARN